MLGLILVQIQWIRGAISLKDEQFKQLVNSTLNDVTRQLEQYYTSSRMNIIIEEELSDDMEINWSIDKEAVEKPVIVLDENKLKQKEFSADKKLKKHLRGEHISEEFVEIVGDTLIIISSSGNKKIDTVHISQYYDEQRKREFEKTLKEQEVLVATIMKKMLLEDVSFEKRVDQKQLEKVLRKNLLDRGIVLDYEYSVIRNNKNEVYHSEKFDKGTDFYYFRAALLVDKLKEEENYLYLYFPGQEALVRGSLGFLGASSLLLTLLIILLFSFALYVIFRQKKLSDIKNDFVNNMTHELKTPISTISLASQMLNDESIPEEKKKTGNISKIIQTESKRLGYQVERVLQMAVLDQGHLVLKCSAVSMHEIISTVIQNFKLQVENHNGKLVFKDDAEYNLVNGDKVHLMNVLTNLIDNAIKYSKEAPEIEIRLADDPRGLKCSVSDKGLGISKENQKKVFDRFFRVSTGNVHDVKGFGLGLSYVKLIIEQHHGSISLESELNKGTRFDIILPLYSEREAS